MGDWVDRFEGLAAAEPEARARLRRAGRLLRVPAGTRVFSAGDEADSLMLLVSGQVRVSHVSESGREIVLYRIRAGQSCVLTTACLMAREAYAAEGVAETEVEAVALPRVDFDALVASSALFRSFVFSSYARRITELFEVIEDVAFQRVDIRLAQRLLHLAGESGRVTATHQQLASELGTAREVISRQLQEFRRRGLVAAARGSLELTDREGLARLAGASQAETEGNLRHAR